MIRKFKVELEIEIDDLEVDTLAEERGIKPTEVLSDYQDDTQGYIEAELGWCRQSFEGFNVISIGEIK